MPIVIATVFNISIVDSDLKVDRLLTTNKLIYFDWMTIVLLCKTDIVAVIN